MDSIDLIRENLKRSETIVLSRIEDMRDHCMVRPSLDGGYHTLWILGLLAYIEGLVTFHFMLGKPNPLADWEDMFDGPKVSGKKEDFVPFDCALVECHAIRASTLSLLDSFDEKDLDQASANGPKSAIEYFGTYRRCFQYSADHWLMHRGQLADARYASGVEQMWY